MGQSSKSFKKAQDADEFIIVDAVDIWAKDINEWPSVLSRTREAIAVAEQDVDRVDYVIRLRMLDGQYVTAYWVLTDGTKKALDIDSSKIDYRDNPHKAMKTALAAISDQATTGGRLFKRY